MMQPTWVKRIALVCLSATISLALRAAGPSAVADSPKDLPDWPPAKPVPFLSGEDAIKTMKLPDNLRIELVATEPMIEHPVAMSFDADGRMWVVEMRSYMPNPEGEGEKAPTGRISVLEDTDGDGRADKSTVFLDDLVLPRAISCVRGGVLVAEPPNLMFCRDTNGDGKCDEKTIIARDYGITGNPEHQPNGLMPALDNWIYSANYDRRLRWMNGAWVFDHVLDCGQWGMTQDNFGHLFHNNNTNQLRGSIVAPHYVERNPNFRASGANEQIAKDQTVWPLHDTAVDRGYLHTIMRDDGTLRKFTAACAPLIYRGGALGPEYENNAFVCEPAANLIKRDIVQQEPDGTLSARNATEGVEFLASTYERFRPVNLYTGPDGAIYILDMHHGLLQHRVYLTTYCKDQYIERQLDKYMETGRIYRIVPKDRKLFPKPNLSKATTPELIATLDHPNGWWRDTAQRLLVERQDYHALSLLRKMATTDANPIARLHALWTIDSYGMSNPADVQPALNDPEPHIRAAALRMAERLLYSPRRNEILPDVMRLANDRDPSVRLQFALTIPPLGLPETDAAVVKLLSENAQQPYLADAVISGLGGRELEFLRQLLASNLWNDKTPVHEAVLGALARCAFADGSPKRVRELLDLIAQQPAKDSWRQVAMLEPLVPPSNAKRQVHPIMLDAEPTTFVSLKESDVKGVAHRVKRVLEVVHWPGEPGYVPPPPPPPLTVEEKARFDRGKVVYAATCIACHKENGLGQEGMAPPLLDSEWVLGKPDRIARIVLNGLSGPVHVNGRSYILEMPSLGKLTDDDIAAALTYVRRNWDHAASPVAPELVKEIRATARPLPWTERELLGNEIPRHQRAAKASATPSTEPDKVKGAK